MILYHYSDLSGGFFGAMNCRNQAPRSLQYFLTSFSNILRCECTSSIMSLHSGTPPMPHSTSSIWSYTLKSWLGSHCSEALVTTTNTHPWTYQHYRTTSCSSRISRLLEDVFSCKAPVPPSEVPDLIQSMEVQHYKSELDTEKWCAPDVPLTSGLPVHHSIASNPNILSSTFDPLQKLAMITRPIRAEITQNVGEWRVWHLDFQQVVTQRDLLGVNLRDPRIFDRALTMLSFAPLSPLKDIGSSLTPSYTTPCGNIDCFVMPKMNVRKLL